MKAEDSYSSGPTADESEGWTFRVCVRLSWADKNKRAEWGQRKRRQKLAPPRAGKAACAGCERGQGGGRPPAPGLRIVLLLSQLGPGLCKTTGGGTRGADTRVSKKRSVRERCFTSGSGPQERLRYCSPWRHTCKHTCCGLHTHALAHTRARTPTSTGRPAPLHAGPC